MLTASGNLCRASRAARATWRGSENCGPEDGGLDASGLAGLGLNGPAQARIAQSLTQLRQQQNREMVPEILPTADLSRKLMCRTVQCGVGLQATYGLMIEALDFCWSSRAEEMLSATFALHRQEIQLLAGLLGGKALSDMASPTPGGIASLNAQLQTIVAKSGAPGLAEMFRLFCFLIAEVSSDVRIARGEVAPAEGEIEISDNNMQFFKLGAETGQPVIFLHGLVDGIAGVQRLQSQFRTGGFRVYAPLRCGYGQSGPVPPVECGIDVFIDQLESLIERENLRRPILLGHRGGAAFTHIAARRLRDRVAGAVIVSGVTPVRKMRELSALPGYSRMIVSAAAYGPGLMPLAVKLWARSVRRNGPMTLLRQKSRPAAKRADCHSDPQLAALLQASHDLTLHQGGAGLIADAHWVVSDWCRHIDGHSAPVVYLHGDDDQVTSVERLQQAMGGRKNVQVRLCRDGGSMLLYSRPELVLAALEELAGT
ncbi:alpha/beta fold hydrolase [Parasedimentitalea psychrophila]|uniref:Alpha/beta hydrolase n=2 Tax=Parasedimentitalea psychrophila TaxID=2997337 RepID=A0A9Y2L4Y8_9RHOB|nr:alpha/beta hydrolase [Parasedimentitalea psychrophila]WIY27487.1 alpha/beta hydrolase [Parasedimentitalea psychrophila]